MGNFVDFQDKVVMDVGAGSGILSLFAAQVSPGSLRLSTEVSGHPEPADADSALLQAGARMVYAVEASDMAGYCRRLAGANPGKT